MKIDRVVKDTMRTLRQILQVLDNNVTVNDNFGKSGAPANAVITSVGEEQVPQWKSLGDIAAVDPSLKGEPGEPGPPGQPGTAGQDANPADVLAQFDKIVTADFGDGEEVVVSGGNVVYVE
jgi:hypothetical protein